MAQGGIQRRAYRYKPQEQTLIHDDHSKIAREAVVALDE
jgi:hypothetical protein